MTSRERVMRALDKKETDRIPFGDFCIDNRNAQAILGRETPIHNQPMWLDRMSEGDWDGLVEQVAKDWVDLALNIGLDWLSIDDNWIPTKKLPIKKGKYKWDWYGNTFTYDPKTMIFTGPKPTEPSVEKQAQQLLSAPPLSTPTPNDKSFEVVRQVADRLNKAELDIPLAMRTHGGMNVQDFLELVALYPDAALIHFKNLAIHAAAIGAKAVENGISILTAGGHVGCNQSSLISPDKFRRCIFPALKIHIDACHRIGAKVLVGSGGCIWPIADAFLIDSNTDGYIGLDTHAGMDLTRLCEEYGGRVCLVGGVDSVLTLSRATETEVREETLSTLKLFEKCPGFMLSSSNSIHNDVKPQNFMAMIKAYRNFYGL
jgi:hypothetical protein